MMCTHVCDTHKLCWEILTASSFTLGNSVCGPSVSVCVVCWYLLVCRVTQATLLTLTGPLTASSFRPTLATMNCSIVSSHQLTLLISPLNCACIWTALDQISPWKIENYYYRSSCWKIQKMRSRTNWVTVAFVSKFQTQRKCANIYIHSW